MNIMNTALRSTAIAALLSLPGAAFAQQAQDTGEGAQTAQTEGTGAASGEGTGAASGDAVSQGSASSNEQADALVATVGGAEIRGSDVMTVIGMLPPQLQSQPPQMLVPMALDQLILRELILEDARGRGLESDPEVQSLVEGAMQGAQDDAIVQVWLDRETAGAVTEEAIQESYAAAQAQGQQNLPPLEEVRPQIEQYLLQQALQDIQARLRQDAEIVFYDPTGRPVEQQGQPSQSGATGTGDASVGQSDSGDAGGDTEGGQSSDGGASAPSDQTQGN